MTAIHWGRRLIYVLLFVAFVVAFGETDEPRTILFLASLLFLTVITLFFLRDDKWNEANTNLAKRERDYEKDIAEWEQHNAHEDEGLTIGQ